MRNLWILTLGLDLLAASLPALAHHSFQAEYNQSKPLTLLDSERLRRSWQITRTDLPRREERARQGGELGLGNLLLLRSLDPDGKCVATGLYVGVNQLAQFWGNASIRSGQIWCPNEALHWYAIRYWKKRGTRVFDWGGGGTYKAKYGCVAVQKPRFCKVRYGFVWNLRNCAQSGWHAIHKFRALGSNRQKADLEKVQIVL